MITSSLLLSHLAKLNVRICSGLILDSCPGEGAYLKTVRGFIIASGANKMTPLPRLFFQAAAYLGVWIGRSVIPCMMGTSNAIVLAARGLNDGLLLETNVPRLYLYSRLDELVPLEEVASHVKDAKERGYLDVQECLFEDTRHCAHLKGDPEKYWSSVLFFLKKI
jgi:pimeloyl-ACP methyl ester carboxylesterase